MLDLEELQKDRKLVKLVAGFFLVFVFGAAMFSYMSGHFQTVVNRERQSFNVINKRLELNLNTRLMAMEFLASDPEIKELVPADVRRELIRPVEILKFFNVGVLDRRGGLVAEVRSTCALQTMYGQENLTKVVAGKNVITDVGICEEDPNIDLSVPIYGDNGEVKAVLIGVILLDEISKLVDIDTLGSNRYIFIKDGNNKKIYYPEGKSEKDFSHDMQIDFNAKVSGVTEDRSMGYLESRLYIYNKVENSNWKIVMVVPMKEIYKLVLQRSFNFFTASCLLLICAILLYRNYRQQRYHDEDRNRLRMERLLSVNQLAAGLAHEIRNPLTSIKGFIQLMARKPDKVPNQNHMEIILTEINRIDKLVGEFQLLTRPLKTPNYVQVDIEQLINDVMVLMESQAVDKSVVLAYINKTSDVLLRKKVYILGDETQLKQVLINLIKNAIEIVDGNGKVNVILSIHEKMAVLTVEDNGIGMPEEIVKKIGTPFFTTKVSGNGLGLSICYNIIHSHGGEIEVDSEVGKGTKFAITLPYMIREE